jgi:hypothetical protein
MVSPMKLGAFPFVFLSMLLLWGCSTPQVQSPGSGLRLARPLTVPSAAGPTLAFDYGRPEVKGNRIGDFMYFVPLISPEPVAMVESTNNQQRARVLPVETRQEGNSFSSTCEFVIAGNGIQENIFDLSGIFRRNQKKLAEGGVVEKQLQYIKISGPGHGAIEIEGTMSNRVPVVNLVRLRFEGFGQPSPVSIGLEDMRSVDGKVRHDNQLVAQVESLTFKRAAGPPKMEVSVGSVKHKDAGNGLWQKFVGNVTGVAANMLIKPLTVEAIGHQSILNFGLALATQQPGFTFPEAKNVLFSRPAGP